MRHELRHQLRHEFEFRAGFVRISSEGLVGTLLAAALTLLALAILANVRPHPDAWPSDRPVVVIERVAP